MRFYAIEITDDAGNIVPVGPFPKSKQQFSSYVNGVSLPGALNVYLDLQIYTWDTPAGGSLVRIWGVSLQDISQATDLNGANIRIFGGMQKGLPLANPAQSGLLLEGKIQQAFGNWQGTEQTLDIIIVSGFGSPDSPKNIEWYWPTGTPMGQYAIQCLDTAFPDFKSTVQIDDRLILATETEHAFYQTVGQLATHLNQVSRSIIGGTYGGVKLTASNKEFLLFDGSSQQTPIQLNAQDFIGQPTWIDFGTVNFKCVMRKDLQVGTYILMPKQTLQLTTAASTSQARNKTAFQGVFLVTEIRHNGNFRQRDANSWVTIVNAVVTQT